MANAEHAAILRTDAVTVTFGGVQALSSVSVSFFAGEVCGLIGPNGAGKTTLFDCLSGVRTPTSGSIYYDGLEIVGRSATWRARQEEGCAVVLVEHDVGFVMRQCDRIAVLNLGAVIADDVPDVVRNDAAVGAAYLG